MTTTSSRENDIDVGGRPLEESLQTLHEQLLTEGDLEETLEHVAGLATAALSRCDFADITLLQDGRPVTKGATDPRATALDAVQYAGDAGPCISAWHERATVRVDSTGDDDRWPRFAAAAFETGVQSILALPLLVRGAPIGALNLYSTRPRAFTEDDEEIGRLFAHQAAIALENARTHRAAVTLAHQLREALDSRATIEQAKGVLMARHGCSADEAFDRLVGASQRENRKLRLVAHGVVESAQRPT